MRRQLALFFVAMQFLTRLPAPPTSGFQPDWLTQSLRYFPAVGALVGWLNIGVWWLASRCFPPVIAFGLMIAVSLLITGALHEDGFADLCDGLGGGATRAAALSIMKDSRIGAFGAIGIGMMLALKWTTLVALPRAAIPAALIASHMLSRWCAIGLIWRLPYVQAGPASKSSAFAGGLSLQQWLLSGALGLLALLPLAFFARSSLRAPLTAPVNALVTAPVNMLVTAPVVAGLAAWLTGAYFKVRLGGYTGDCLGAIQQISELSFLLTVLAVLGCTGDAALARAR